MSRSLRAIIDKTALRHNVNRVRELAPKCPIIAMVKANGYGHGLTTVAKLLDQVDAFGVACIEEAIVLREANITQRIILMEGIFSAKELADVQQFSLEMVIHEMTQVNYLLEKSDINAKEPFRIWLKVDTGMNRLGFCPTQLLKAYDILRTLPYVVIMGVMTHFSQADQSFSDSTRLQISRFNEIIQKLPIETIFSSLANSAAILNWPAARVGWVRPGIMLYGVSPMTNQTGAELGLKPVMTLSSKLIAIKHAAKGEYVGYSGGFYCQEAKRIGVVAIGYGDGFPRRLEEKVSVMVKGKLAPLIGYTSMDMATIDLSEVPEACIGDDVTLWGPEIPVEKIALATRRIPYELLTSLGERVQRIVE